MDIKEQTTRRIQEKIESGAYADANEVVEQALDALDEAEISDEELRNALAIGIAELDRGAGIPAENVIAELRSKHQANVNNTNA